MERSPALTFHVTVRCSAPSNCSGLRVFRNAAVLRARSASCSNVVSLSSNDGMSYLREARAAALGGVGSDLHLLREREHVREEPRVDQHLRRDVLRGRVLGGLLQDRGEVLESADHRRYRGLMHRNSHLLSFSVKRVA
jgi:hypothetical protein